MTRTSVSRRVIVWIIGSALGAAIVALPDSDERVFSLSRTHGPSPVDLVGVAVLVGSWLPVAVALPALWRAAGAVPARLSALLALVGASGLGVTIAADLGNIWAVAVAMVVVAQLIVIVDALRPVPSTPMATLSASRIRHLVVFTLRHEGGTPEAEAFLAALRSLAAVNGVEELEVMRQVGRKNSYQFAVTMEFASRPAYDAYNAHPDHVAFVRDHWDVEVTDFMEIDLAAL